MLLSLPFPVIDPFIIEFGGFGIRWYALAYLAGFLGGWRYCLALADHWDQPPTAKDIDDFLSWGVLGVVFGGRLGYTLLYQPDYYLEHWLEIPAIWQGGMSFHGGLLGMMLAMLLFARRKGVPLLALSDIVACAVPIGLFFGRLANFANNELWGRPTDLPWGVEFPIPEPLQTLIPQVARHPSQLYEAFCEGLLLFALLFVLVRRPAVRERTGLLTGVFLLGYGLFRFFIEFVREPDYFAEALFLTAGQVLCLPMIVGGAVLVLYRGAGKR